MAGETLLRSMGSPVWCSEMTWRNGIAGGREAQKRGQTVLLAHHSARPTLFGITPVHSIQCNTKVMENYFHTPRLRYALKI